MNWFNEDCWVIVIICKSLNEKSIICQNGWYAFILPYAFCKPSKNFINVFQISITSIAIYE